MLVLLLTNRLGDRLKPGKVILIWGPQKKIAKAILEAISRSGLFRKIRAREYPRQRGGDKSPHMHDEVNLQRRSDAKVCSVNKAILVSLDGAGSW